MVALDTAIDIGRLSRTRRHRGRLLLAGLGLVLCLAALAALGAGAVPIPPLEVLSGLAGLGIDGPAGAFRSMVLLEIRLPRVLLGLLVGAALAVCGAALQGLFRNPLADPGLIGVSTGAALAAAAAIVLREQMLEILSAGLLPFLLPVCAFGGGLAATLLVYRIARREGRTDVATMLLAGIAVNAIAGAGIGFLIFVSNDQQLRDLNFWLLGSLGGATWHQIAVAAPLILLPTLLLLLFARRLDALLLGEREALHLGFPVEPMKRAIVVLVALAVGAAVAVTGVIGFVGLVVPHLIRLMIGPGHRLLLPASILLGAALMLAADLTARIIVLPAELPVGILTACIGGPFFLWLLVRHRGQGLW